MYQWDWTIIIYLFLGGLGAGAYLTSFAAEKGILGENSPLKRAGYYLSAPVVALGALLLVFDLGQGFTKPWLLVRLLINPSSVMTWGTYILFLFIIAGLIKGFFVFRNKAAPNILTWAGAVLAIATGAYTGLLLMVIKAVPFWNTFIMPLMFVVSAISTGLSKTSIAAHLMEKETRSNADAKETRVRLALFALELAITAVFFGFMLFGLNGTAGAESASLVMFGNYAVFFWVCFIGLGLLFPLAALLSGIRSAGLALAADFGVLVGGLTLRALIVLAALPVWDGTI